MSHTQVIANSVANPEVAHTGPSFFLTLSSCPFAAPASLGFKRYAPKHRNAITPSGFKCQAVFKSPAHNAPTDLVLPQNGQGCPVSALNQHNTGPFVNRPLFHSIAMLSQSTISATSRTGRVISFRGIAIQRLAYSQKPVSRSVPKNTKT